MTIREIALWVALIVLCAVGGGLIWRLRRTIVRLRSAFRPAVSLGAAMEAIADGPAPAPIKCHTVTYTYADGTARTVHSICDGDGKAHDDAHGQALYPGSPLVHTRGGVHYL